MAEQRFNRNYLIVGALALATLAAFWFIENPPLGSQQRSEETERVVDDLNQEILELESSILELELVYSEKDAELDQSQQLIQEKNARLTILEQKVDSLEQRGELDSQTISRLREAIRRAQQSVETRDQVNVLVQDISYLTRNTDSLVILLRNRDSILDVALARIEQYKQDLANCGGQSSISDPSDAIRAPRIWMENFRIYNVLNGKKVDIGGQVKANDVQRLQFCFNLKGNQLVVNGDKQVYMILKQQGGPVLNNRPSGSGSFNLQGREQVFTGQNIAKYGNGKSNELCIQFVNENPGDLAFGRYYVELYHDGKLLDTRKKFDVR